MYDNYKISQKSHHTSNIFTCTQNMWFTYHLCSFKWQWITNDPNKKFHKNSQSTFQIKHYVLTGMTSTVFAGFCSSYSGPAETLYLPIYVTVIHRDFIINSSPKLSSHCAILLPSCGTQVAIHSVHHPLLKKTNFTVLICWVVENSTHLRPHSHCAHQILNNFSLTLRPNSGLDCLSYASPLVKLVPLHWHSLRICKMFLFHGNGNMRPTPHPQPGWPGYLSLSGNSLETCPT